MNDLGTITLETKRLILRRFVNSDASEVYNNWTSDMNLDKYVSWSIHKDISETTALINQWIEEYETNNYNWVVEKKETHELIGNISTIHISRKHHNCEIGYCYGSKYWNQGYATEALCAVINYLKNECLFHVVEAKHLSTNPASGRVMEKAGMSKEAILKNRRYNSESNEYCDLVYYSF